jgi:hypothetical protein
MPILEWKYQVTNKIKTSVFIIQGDDFKHDF